MDGIGSLDLNWLAGYSGNQLQFIAKDVVCFKCGINVKFVKGSNEESVFSSPGDGLSAIAAHGVNKVFAVADKSIPPKIFVISYPTFQRRALLEEAAELEIICLAFSTSDYLASISGVPDYKLTIWNYIEGTKLCTADASHVVPNSISFNPANWRQLCITAPKELAVWTVEQSGGTSIIQSQKVVLPAVDGVMEEPSLDRDLPTRASTHMTRATVDLPRTSIARVKGDEADNFQEYEDTHERAMPLSHCWMPTGDVLIGCAGGQLLKVDGECFSARMLYNPGPYAYASFTKEPVLDGSQSQDQSQSELHAADSTERLLGEGSINALALHKGGLFLAGDDGALRHIELVHNNKLRMKQTFTLGYPVTSLAFNTAHRRLAVGSANGTIQTLDLAEEYEFQTLREDHFGNFVVIDMLSPGTDSDHCVTLREDGEVQVWSVESGRLVSSMPLGVQGTSMASSPLIHGVAIGTAMGFVYFVDCSKLDQMRIIQRIKLHQGPVKNIRFNRNGKFLLTTSDDNHSFVLDGRPSKKFDALGYINIPGDTQAIGSWMETSGLTKVVITTNSTGKAHLGATKLCVFTLPANLAVDVKSKHASLKCNFKEDVVDLMVFNFPVPSFGIILREGNIAYSLAQNNKCLQKFIIPDFPTEGDDKFLEVVDKLPGHQLMGGQLSLSRHHKWLASCAPDGKIILRTVDALAQQVQVAAHDYSSGGSVHAVFTPDGTRLLSSGKDGVLACFKWNFSQTGLKKAKDALDHSLQMRVCLLGDQKTEDAAMATMEDWSPPMVAASRPGSGVEKSEKELAEKDEAIEKAMAEDAIYSTPTPTPSGEATWLELRQIEALKAEDQGYSSVKADLRSEIRDMRRQLQTMMKDNEEVADIERLDADAFDLDVEEQARLQAEGEAEVQRIREEKEFDNLAKAYLADLIKRECWDDMVVKGRGIAAFNSHHECHNYPMKARTREQLNRLQAVQERREVEIEELAARKEYADITQKSTTTPEDELLDADDETGAEEQPSTTGSLVGHYDDDQVGVQYGGGSKYFYSQFEINMREQKMNQIVLLEDAIYRIRMAFNKEFEGVYLKKEQEITKICERNKRIRKILSDLAMPVDVTDPELGVTEKPEMLLTVKDDEVKVEKFLTPEQRRQAEEEKKAEEERLQRERGDNWRERGLNMMMGGVLEIKKEDELKKDIPMPAFMTAKAESEWTEDEKKAAQDYERRVKELEDERDKYHKQLEQELRKLQTQITEGTVQFDETLVKLFNRKIKTEMVIYQEELKILRLKYSLLQEEELDHREAELNHMLEFKQQMKTLNNVAVMESRKHMDAFREQYDILVAEDKVMDKAFKREFNDVPAHFIDLLHKLFRRRPRGQKARATSETPIYDPSSGNPFAERPSTARQTELAASALESALAELDKDVNMPEGLEMGVWERMCVYRRQKIESEQLVKQKALVLADMQAFYQKRQEEAENIKMELEDLVNSISSLKEDRMRFLCNLQVQLLMKQGQVEVEGGSFVHDYLDSILIHRSTVEELNGKIRQFGETKIASMMESKDFRKSIVQLEWEHKKMMMETEDLQNKMRDIQNLKVTREIQAFLNEEDYDSKKSQEIATLEQTLLVQKQHHDKNVRQKKKQLKELKKTVNERTADNSGLSCELEELNVSVNERRHIHEVNADKRSDAGRDKRYKEIVQRRQFVELAKAQAQEVAVLRAEVERLRMRTFPALVQVEH